jgi:hypothetical protein
VTGDGMGFIEKIKRLNTLYEIQVQTASGYQHFKPVAFVFIINATINLRGNLE